MKHALLALLMCATAFAQTKEAPKTAPKAAAKAPAATAKAPAATAAKPVTKAAPKAAAKATTAKLPAAALKAPGMDLMKPDTIKGKPPEIFVVRLQTTKGNVDIRVVRSWAPVGVERFYNLVRAGYYDNTYFFRVLDFMAQVGISSKPELNTIWSDREIQDDRPLQPNLRGRVTFAKSGAPNSRTTQFFINKLDENVRLDSLGFAPFGEVVEGMEVVDQIYGGYGEPPMMQAQLQSQGEPFLNRNFPRLDKIIKASIIAIVQP